MGGREGVRREERKEGRKKGGREVEGRREKEREGKKEVTMRGDEYVNQLNDGDHFTVSVCIKTCNWTP